MLTPQAPGRPAALLRLRLGIDLAACFKQLHAVWRSGVVLAAALRDLTPLQHGIGIGPPDLKKPMHGANVPLTCPHVMAWALRGPVTNMHRTKAETSLRAAIWDFSWDFLFLFFFLPLFMASCVQKLELSEWKCVKG